ncbi:XRE family transcriptional regulator [Pseudomonas syringae group genomosp. 3]|uniref:XRE family transcriptional regulator n=1 Tax=Pseudomonas syringae group genomosp. 3 TaxID=251701 RepID=UPI0001E27EE3|nr:helix-turn-helix transcriptional regulator [Pseudomonas syringae group genomosp. 3]
MNLSERIKLARKEAHLTQSELAEKVGIAQTAISQLESGKTLRSSYLLQIAQECGVNSLWLQTGEGDIHTLEDPKDLWAAALEELVSGEHEDDAPLNNAVRKRIEALQAVSKFAPSNSLLTSEIPYLIELDDPDDPSRTAVEISATARLDLNNEILEKQGVGAEHVVAVAISGNSMSPVLHDGSTVLANMNESLVVDGKMYVIDHGGQIRVKALYRLPGGGIRVRSYNTAEHPDETYTAREMEDSRIRIMGRVFWGASFY